MTLHGEQFACCPCCGVPCRFNADSDDHNSLCPVCETECPHCRRTHPPSTALVVPASACTGP